MAGEDAPAEPIIIVRRKGYGEEEGHHGGVWKIAYADFMTAMMAFFLVMWLINAANTETRAAVASYFNPLRLTDNASRKKGLKTVDDKANAEDEQRASGKADHQGDNKGGGGGPQPEQSGESVKRGKLSGLKDGIDNAIEERHMMALSNAKSAPSVKRESPFAAGASTSQSGQAFRDPFNPLVPSTSLEGPPGLSPAAGPDAAGHAAKGLNHPGSNGTGQQDEAGANAIAGGPMTGESKGPILASSQASASSSAARQDGGEKAGGSDEGAALAAAAASLRSKVLDTAAKLGAAGGPGIDVRVEGESIVLSLTDTETFGMFAIGSAAASEQTVKLISGIAPVVAESGDGLVIRGHTDGREYRTSANSNWRLSMARAETAVALLTKAGISDKRIVKIEAHADRMLKIRDDPNAASNRRIEILIAAHARRP